MIEQFTHRLLDVPSDYGEKQAELKGVDGVVFVIVTRAGRERQRERERER